MRVGIEATGYSPWFGRLLAELGIEVCIIYAANTKTSLQHSTIKMPHSVTGRAERDEILVGIISQPAA